MTAPPADATTADLRDDELLTNVYRAISRWPKWRQVRDYADDYGRYAFLVESPVAYHLCAAKGELYRGLASFMEHKIVERCRDLDCDHDPRYRLTLFVGTPPTMGSAWVFHPETVRTVADQFQTTSKKGAPVDALQLDADRWGVLLGDYVSRQVRDDELPRPERTGPRETTFSTFEVRKQ